MPPPEPTSAPVAADADESVSRTPNLTQGRGGRKLPVTKGYGRLPLLATAAAPPRTNPPAGHDRNLC